MYCSRLNIIMQYAKRVNKNWLQIQMTLRYKELTCFTIRWSRQRAQLSAHSPSSVDCWMIYFYHHHSAHRRGWCFLVEGWTQWWHPLCCCFIVNGHQPSRLQIDLQQLQPLLCYTLATRCWLHLQLRRWMQLRRLEMLPGLCRRRQRYVMVDRNFSRARGVSWKWPWLSRHRGKCYFHTGIRSFLGTAE